MGGEACHRRLVALLAAVLCSAAAWTLAPGTAAAKSKGSALPVTGRTIAGPEVAVVPIDGSVRVWSSSLARRVCVAVSPISGGRPPGNRVWVQEWNEYSAPFTYCALTTTWTLGCSEFAAKPCEIAWRVDEIGALTDFKPDLGKKKPKNGLTASGRTLAGPIETSLQPGAQTTGWLPMLPDAPGCLSIVNTSKKDRITLPFTELSAGEGRTLCRPEIDILEDIEVGCPAEAKGCSVVWRLDRAD